MAGSPYFTGNRGRLQSPGYNARMSLRFQFSLSKLLIFIAIISVPCAWIAYNANIAHQRLAVRRTLGLPGACLLEIGIYFDGTTPRDVSWIRQAIGDWPATAFWWDSSKDKSREALQRVHSLFPEAHIIDAKRRNFVFEGDQTLRIKGAQSGVHPAFLRAQK